MKTEQTCPHCKRVHYSIYTAEKCAVRNELSSEFANYVNKQNGGREKQKPLPAGKGKHATLVREPGVSKLTFVFEPITTPMIPPPTMVATNPRMKTNIFESFVEILNGIPASGMLKAIELERQVLKDDLAYKRVSGGEELASIFSFCEFVKAVAEKDMITPVSLSMTHVVGYRTIVMRLIEAAELPATALEQFNLTFSPGLSNTLVPGDGLP
jgi:hypothetical protein